MKLRYLTGTEHCAYSQETFFIVCLLFFRDYHLSLVVYEDLLVSLFEDDPHCI